ncbi:MAG TPA: PEGA domain-containing protein [Candidatus Dormibacteraeota bacterium]|jgi:hypothetical protein|nr:PEGA domain-containing protein [Candidatus Dormibacteraeota bacterium]
MAMDTGSKLRGFTVICFLLLFAASASAQSQVMGKIRFLGASKVEKTSGVWIDGGYVGYLGELKENNTVSLLPGEHEIAVRQAGYQDFKQTVVVEPGKELILQVAMQKDPLAQYPKVTAKVKLDVIPDRAAVFLDDLFVGHVQEFRGFARAMLVSPGKHRVKIALPGYRTFETEINLLPKQTFTIKTELVKGSITQADPLIKKEEPQR